MTRIQIRRDTSNNWATYNPILADGEFALETDTRKIKIGNGEQPYTELAYQGDSELPDNITTQGNTFNGANQLVQLDSTGKLPAIDGSQLTNMVTTDTSQTIPGAKTFNKIVLPNDSSDKGIYIGDNTNPSIFAYRNSLSINDLLSLSIQGSLTMKGASPSLHLGDYTNDANFVINLRGYDTNATKIYPIMQVNNNIKRIALGNDTFSITDHNGNNIVTTNNIPTKGLKYWTGTEAAYTELGTKDADTLYRTTDTNKVYLGTIQIGGN